MSVRENIALIGYGYWGKKLYKYLKQSPHFSLQYVYFPSLQKFSPGKIRSEYGGEFTADLDKIWTDPSLRNVVIATPIPTHFEVVQAALSYNKNVLVEKPCTIHYSEARQLADIAFRQGLILETEYTYTYSQALHKARTLVAERAIGGLRSISIQQKQLGRFLPYDVYLLLGSHALSILDLFVPLDELEFSTVPTMERQGVTTAAATHFTKSGGFAGSIDLSLHCPKKERKVIICGEKGTIIYAPDDKDILTLVRYEIPDAAAGQAQVIENRTFAFDENNNLEFAVNNFYECVARKKESNIQRSLRINAALDMLRKNSVPTTVR